MLQSPSSSGEGNGKPFQYPCLGNPMDRGAWWATVHGVAESQTRLSMHTHMVFPCVILYLLSRGMKSLCQTTVWPKGTTVLHAFLFTLRSTVLFHRQGNRFRIQMLHTCQGSSLQMHSQHISPLCPQNPGLCLCDSASKSRHLKPWQKKKKKKRTWQRMGGDSGVFIPAPGPTAIFTWVLSSCELAGVLTDCWWVKSRP